MAPKDQEPKNSKKPPNWSILINTQKSNFITLKENELDKLLWMKNSSIGEFSANLVTRYKQLKHPPKKKNGGGSRYGKQ